MISLFTVSGLSVTNCILLLGIVCTVYTSIVSIQSDFLKIHYLMNKRAVSKSQTIYHITNYGPLSNSGSVIRRNECSLYDHSNNALHILAIEYASLLQLPIAAHAPCSKLTNRYTQRFALTGIHSHFVNLVTNADLYEILASLESIDNVVNCY